MKKLLFFLCATIVMACNNQAANSKSSKDTATGSTTVSGVSHFSKESEMEILAGCIDNAKASNVDEAKAYALCRCVLKQVQEKYPQADSTALVDHLSDTTQVAQMVQQCK
jgi:hypothetical protein